MQGSAREVSIEGGQCKANSKYYRKGSAREGSIEGGQTTNDLLSATRILHCSMSLLAG